MMHRETFQALPAETKLVQDVVQKINEKPEDCLFIDDVEENLEPAREMGIKTILFRSQEQLEEELKGIGVEF